VRTAVAAAVAVGREVGLSVDEPRLLRDLTNVVVHLAPSPVVARVPVTFTRLRGREWIERELELTEFLADAGASIVRPTPLVDPGPHQRNGFMVTLWEFVEHDPNSPLDARCAGAALREIHELLEERNGVGLDHFAHLDEIATLVSQLDLEPVERQVFDQGLDAAARLAQQLDAPLQPVHGDAHLANILRTATGVLWTDFENACLGPRELDIACNEIRARTRGRQPEDDDLLAGYGHFDEGLVTRLIPIHALFLAAWTFALAERTEGIRPYAEERLGWVREGFAL
jgi:hypothetical protein